MFALVEIFTFRGIERKSLQIIGMQVRQELEEKELILLSQSKDLQQKEQSLIVLQERVTYLY